MSLSAALPEIDPAPDLAPHENPARAPLDALLHRTAIFPLADLGWLRVTGGDRVRWLNGMVTNSILALSDGEGCFNFLLNAQGRIQGTATAFAEPDAVLLQTDRAQLSLMNTLLDRFIIMDDVELTDVTADRTGLGVAGPHAATALEALGLMPSALTPLHRQAAPWRGGTVEMIAAYSPLVPRFELWSSAETIAALTQVLTEGGAVPVAPEALEHLRLLEGTPRYGTDIRNTETARDLPQETNQARALHFAKGCYLGQEIVERIRSRGSVHRTFTGLRCEGSLPAAGTVLQAAGKPVGEITSAATIPLATGPVTLALGYLRREALSAEITFPGGVVHPASLPFPAA